MLDISQTSAKPVTKTNSYDDKTMLKAFLHESPVDIKAVDDLPNGKGAEWNKEDNVCIDLNEKGAIFPLTKKQTNLLYSPA